MMPINTNSAAFREVIAAYRQIESHDEDVAAARKAMAEITVKRQSLGDRLDALKRNAPRQAVPEEVDLVEAIASNPATAVDPKRLEQASKSRAKWEEQTGAWKAEIAILERADAKLADQLTPHGETMQEVMSQQSGAWERFIRVSHDFMVREFEAHFAPLVEEFLMPLDALNNHRIGKERVIGGRERQVHADTHVEVFEYAGGDMNKTILYPPREFMRMDWSDKNRLREQRLEAFIQLVIAALPKTSS